MKKQLPFLPWRPFGPKRPEFYLCHCENCDFTKTYEVGDCDVVSLDDTETDSVFERVKTLPKVCPKCGKKLKKTKIPSPIKY